MIVSSMTPIKANAVCLIRAAIWGDYMPVRQQGGTFLFQRSVRAVLQELEEVLEMVVGNVNSYSKLKNL